MWNYCYFHCHLIILKSKLCVHLQLKEQYSPGVLFIKVCVGQVINLCVITASMHKKIGIYYVCMHSCIQRKAINPRCSKLICSYTATPIWIKKCLQVAIYGKQLHFKKPGLIRNVWKCMRILMHEQNLPPSMHRKLNKHPELNSVWRKNMQISCRVENEVVWD